MVRVDIGIVTFNTRELTLAALERLEASIASSGCSGLEVRVLVHDNASSDGTAEAIRRERPGIDVVQGTENQGFGAGMNRLLERSAAPWFFALNSDAWPEPGAVEALVAAAAADPTAAAVAPLLLRPDGALEHSTFPFPSLAVAAVTALGGYRWLWPRLSRRWALVGAWDHDEPRTVDWAVGAALLMRRRAVDEIGGFDESLFMYAEDLEWCWRAEQGGWTVRFEPAAVVRHVGNASAGPTYGRTRARAHILNGYRVYRRMRGLPSAVAYRALSVVGCARLYLLARLRRDGPARAVWADHIRAHLSRVPDRDGPPEALCEAGPVRASDGEPLGEPPRSC